MTIAEELEQIRADEEAWIMHGWDWTFKEFLEYRRGGRRSPMPPPESDDPA